MPQGFSVLRVINEDRVASGAGFPTHGHRDREISSYVLDGALAHHDSLGNGAVIRPGEVQGLSAGTGLRHSEFNASSSEPVHFLQIWILPKSNGIVLGYEQKRFAPAELDSRLRLVAPPDGHDGSVSLQRNAYLCAAQLNGTGAGTHSLAPGRRVYPRVARGALRLSGARLAAGDGMAIQHERALGFAAAAARTRRSCCSTAPESRPCLIDSLRRSNPHGCHRRSAPWPARGGGRGPALALRSAEAA